MAASIMDFFWIRSVSLALHSMAELSEILSDAGVQDTFIDKLKDDGWNVDLFALCAGSPEEFKDELPEILGTTRPITTPLQRSALLLAWQRCRQSTEQVKDPPQAAPSQASEAATPASSWSETFPPKLTSDVVLAMKQKFKQNYPAEILLPETMPSLRLLSLMHHQKTKKEYRWVPWKYRISQAKSDELTIGKTSRLAKAEGLQLHSLLLDSPPEIQIENGAMGMHALRQTFETYSYAMAMLELAHLATMKQYYMRFINLMTTRMDSETGLRNPTILEAQSADKALMGIACELVMEQNWNFDDALHEITFIRAEIHNLLQPRPRLPKQTMQRIENSTGKGLQKGDRPGPYSKGKGKKGGSKSAGKSSGKVSWVTEATVNGSKRQLCMRFQSGKCTLGSECRFHHGFAYPLPSGEACGKNHGALMHEKTPH